MRSEGFAIRDSHARFTVRDSRLSILHSRFSILAAGDIHGKAESADAVLYAVGEQKPDLLVLAGDITTFGPAKFASDFLRRIPVEIFSVPGNCDTPDVIKALDSGNSVCIHRKSAEFRGMKFAGFGGSQRNPAPYVTPLEFDEGEILECLGKIAGAAAVVITHSPPEGILDSPDGYRHIGSNSVRRIVEKFRPPLAICSHVHQCAGVVRCGETTVVNCTMGEGSGGAIINIGEKGEVTAKLL
ncbi:MAG: hypothetical protein CVT47_01175 [Thermoplasmata archaeon HGW-Thermoplasmata-2]|nr:MAG: hypothetical protein CVT47_01175 [Thermoplasmata archaeon HGW-Thermoplasmata-2]